MPYCSNCGKEIKVTDKFCSECGAEQKPETVEAETRGEIPSHKKRLNRWYALFSCVALEIVAIVGAQPLITVTEKRWFHYPELHSEIVTVQRAWWDYDWTIACLLIVGITLNLFITRHETKKFRVATTLAVAFILLGTALGITRL